MNTFIVINKCRRIFIKVLLALLFNNNLKVELKTHQSAALQPQFVLAKLWEFGLLNPSAWSDGHCPHAARSHSFVYISTS